MTLSIFCTSGIQYAAVLPLPVRALARMSRPSRASGIALLCTRVGRAKPRSARDASILESNVFENAAEKLSLESTSLGSAIIGGKREFDVMLNER